jgi:hypothetical protein
LKKYIKIISPDTVFNEGFLRETRNLLLKQVGIKEKTNNNDGEQIESYLKSVNLTKGQPYCAAGQYWVFNEISKKWNYQNPLYKTGSVNRMFDEFIKYAINVPFFLDIDDLIVWKYKNKFQGHIERVINVIDEKTVQTVGFNTQSGESGSQRDGGGVYIRKRKIGILGNMYLRGVLGFRMPIIENKNLSLNLGLLLE